MRLRFDRRSKQNKRSDRVLQGRIGREEDEKEEKRMSSSTKNALPSAYVLISSPPLFQTDCTYTIHNALPWDIKIARQTAHGVDAQLTIIPPGVRLDMTGAPGSGTVRISQGDVLVIRDREDRLLMKPQAVSYIRQEYISNNRLRITIGGYLYDPLPSSTTKMSSDPTGVASIRVSNFFMFPIDIKNPMGSVIAQCGGYDVPGGGNGRFGGSKSNVDIDNRWNGFKRGDTMSIWRRDTGTYLMNMRIDDTYATQYNVGMIITQV